MKKIIVVPKTDTVTICLPEDWVGIPIECKFSPVRINLKKARKKTENKKKQ